MQLSRRFPKTILAMLITYMSLMSSEIVNTLINFLVESNHVLKVLYTVIIYNHLPKR